MTPRTLLLGAAVVAGLGLAVSRLPATRRFVRTVRTEARRREAELREAVEVAVRTDASTRAPRHAAGAEVPDLRVAAGWDPDRPDERVPDALGAGDPGRSLTPEEARALLLDPAGPRAVASEPPDGRAR